MVINENHFRELITGQASGWWPALQRGALWTASVPFGWTVCLRNSLYNTGWIRSHRATVPVVSVGNLTLGGTGKTPCVEYVAGFYRDHGKREAILSRGYGAENGRNDEALVLEENLPGIPHLQGADRVALAAAAVRQSQIDLLVLDDGFQHRRLARDLDVVLLDATQSWGDGWIFPRGLLRESGRGLSRAGVVLLTRCDQVTDRERGRLREAVAQVAPSATYAEAMHRPEAMVNLDGDSIPLAGLADKPTAAFCGIGNPESFRRTLIGLGCKVEALRVFPDHHAYSNADVSSLIEWAPRDLTLVTTQKDMVKLRSMWPSSVPLWALRVKLRIVHGQEEFDRKLLAVMDANRIDPTPRVGNLERANKEVASVSG